MEKIIKAQQEYIEFLEYVINDCTDVVNSRIRTSMKSYRNKIKKARKDESKTN